MSTIYHVGPHWRGYAGLKRLVIFGDSYSYIGYHSQAPPPTAARPLGVNFPGTVVNEPGQPNWVGHLITTYAHGQSNLLVYDYAVRGDTAPGVARQIREHFLPTVGRRPNWARWTANDTLFVTWIGVQDCRLFICGTVWLNDVDSEIYWYTNDRREITYIITALFAAQEELYTAGARNFLFVDCPPIHRSPVGPPDENPESAQPFTNWNQELATAATAFARAHPDATVLVFSAWATFTRILDDPLTNGFPLNARRAMGGPIWFDHLHPTSRVAKTVARDMAGFLTSIPPSG